MIFLCSRYEGMDARIIQQFNIFEISIGDYILFDGDTSAITIYNAIIRDKMVKKTAKLNESFDNFLLEHDQFTHPKIYLNHLVPEELYGGNHKNILNWQLYNSIKKTLCKRPDLYRMYIEYMDNL
jgi:tRNA (guanine37-N1)-methyltransferase